MSENQWDETFRDLLREERLRHGLTQAELAKRAGFTQQQLAKIESGAQRVKLSDVGELARALHVPVVMLISRAPKPASSKKFREEHEALLARIDEIDEELTELRSKTIEVETRRQALHDELVAAAANLEMMERLVRIVGERGDGEQASD